MTSEIDVGIIGGGVIGLSCAWRLAQGGARVAVFERATVGREASWAAAGMLAAQCEAAHHPPLDPEDIEYSMLRRKQQAMFDLCLESRAMYGDFADELFAETNLDIELSIANHCRNDERTPGILYVQSANDDAAFSRFAQQQERGLTVENAPDFNGFPSLWLPQEGQVNNRVLAQALLFALRKLKVPIFENEEVRCVQSRDLKRCEIVSSRRQMKCENVLLCGGARSSRHAQLPQNCAPPIKPVAGQMIALRSPKIPRHIIYGSDVYLVPRRDGRVLVGATMENVGFDAQTSIAAAKQLFANAARLIPDLEEDSIEDQWAGLRPQTPDGLPVLSRGEAEGFYVATGHFRNGILLAPITAKLMADCILRNIEPPREFALQRFTHETLRS